MLKKIIIHDWHMKSIIIIEGARLEYVRII
jgi:hypothetical protein